MAHDIDKRRRKCLRQDWFLLICALPTREVLRQHLDQRNAERPNISGRGFSRADSLGRVVNVGLTSIGA
jgi:hypothetical protein